jgi:hypothetical protein
MNTHMRESHVNHHRFSFQTFSPDTFKSETLAACSTRLQCRNSIALVQSHMYASKSGSMSNELNNIICQNTDGVYKGVAIGGERYLVSHFIDHLLRYNDSPSIHMLVLPGGVGGVNEYESNL